MKHETLLKLKILNNETLFYHFDIVLMCDAYKVYQSDTKVFQQKKILRYFLSKLYFRVWL